MTSNLNAGLPLKIDMPMFVSVRTSSTYTTNTEISFVLASNISVNYDGLKRNDELRSFCRRSISNVLISTSFELSNGI